MDKRHDMFFFFFFPSRRVLIWDGFGFVPPPLFFFYFLTGVLSLILLQPSPWPSSFLIDIFAFFYLLSPDSLVPLQLGDSG